MYSREKTVGDIEVENISTCFRESGAAMIILEASNLQPSRKPFMRNDPAETQAINRKICEVTKTSRSSFILQWEGSIDYFKPVAQQRKEDKKAKQKENQKRTASLIRRILRRAARRRGRGWPPCPFVTGSDSF
jgi:hypothetical protein